MHEMRLVAAFDKFRGSLTATEACRAASVAADRAGWETTQVPLADGGEGTLEALGGPNRSSMVTGPLGDQVTAQWRLADGVAVIEMARASGLILAGGADGNDPVTATTRGTGELIRDAAAAGATRIIIGVGGSATTDGGWGAVQAMGSLPDSVTLEVACDVTTLFTDAARVYGPQKGATSRQVEELTRRLEEVADRYAGEGVDVRSMPGSGAAGGLAGGLAARGASLRSGFDVVADEVGLDRHLDTADLVVTGEGKLDETSWQGKVVGGVTARADVHGVPCFVIVGSVDVGVQVPNDLEVASLVDLLGSDQAFRRAADGIEALVAARLTRSR